VVCKEVRLRVGLEAPGIATKLNPPSVEISQFGVPAPGAMVNEEVKVRSPPWQVEAPTGCWVKTGVGYQVIAEVAEVANCPTGSVAITR
jgi:hypothetical protein